MKDDIITAAILEHQPKRVFAAFSGGHDSLVSTHLAMTSGLADCVVTIDTGIGIPETLQFVKDVCKSFGWPLLVYAATENTRADGTPDPVIYEDIVLKMGFPGASQHTRMYNRLKERQLRRLKRDHVGRRAIIGLVTGIRREESSRRMGYVQPVNKMGSWLWLAPCCEWSGQQCSEYMAEHNLPRNPVKDRLCMSGECLCGAFAKKNELKEIRFWYPEVADRIERLEKRAREAGHPWGWEDNGPPNWAQAEKAGQMSMLCTSCNFRHDALNNPDDPQDSENTTDGSS